MQEDDIQAVAELSVLLYTVVWTERNCNSSNERVLGG